MNSGFKRLGAQRFRGRQAFTLAEVLISLAVSIISVSSVIWAYILTSKGSAKSSYSAAANAALVRQMEQVRGARWDVRASPAVDELVTLNATTNVVTLNLPVSSTNLSAYSYATNIISVQLISTNPLRRLIRVDCMWRVPSANTNIYTNTLVSYRSPDI